MKKQQTQRSRSGLKETISKSLRGTHTGSLTRWILLFGALTFQPVRGVSKDDWLLLDNKTLYWEIGDAWLYGKSEPALLLYRYKVKTRMGVESSSFKRKHTWTLNDLLKNYVKGTLTTTKVCGLCDGKRKADRKKCIPCGGTGRITATPDTVTLRSGTSIRQTQNKQQKPKPNAVIREFKISRWYGGKFTFKIPLNEANKTRLIPNLPWNVRAKRLREKGLREARQREKKEEEAHQALVRKNKRKRVEEARKKKERDAKEQKLKESKVRDEIRTVYYRKTKSIQGNVYKLSKRQVIDLHSIPENSGTKNFWGEDGTRELYDFLPSSGEYLVVRDSGNSPLSLKALKHKDDRSSYWKNLDTVIIFLVATRNEYEEGSWELVKCHKCSKGYDGPPCPFAKDHPYLDGL